jgi:hypothetical protein
MFIFQPLHVSVPVDHLQGAHIRTLLKLLKLHARIQELRICCHTKQTTYISVLNFKFYQSVILARKSVCSLLMTHNVSKHVGVTNE